MENPEQETPEPENKPEDEAENLVNQRFAEHKQTEEQVKEQIALNLRYNLRQARSFISYCAAQAATLGLSAEAHNHLGANLSNTAFIEMKIEEELVDIGLPPVPPPA